MILSACAAMLSSVSWRVDIWSCRRVRVRASWDMCGSEESRKEARRLTALVYWDRGTVWIIGGARGWVSAAWTWGWLSCQRLF